MNFDLLSAIVLGGLGIICFAAGSFLGKPKVQKVLNLVGVLATSLADGTVSKDEAAIIAAKIEAVLGK